MIINISIKWILPIILSYLIGTIPIGLIISKILKDDVRKHGSGNIGSTNMTRTYGKKYGKITFIFDLLKAVIVFLLTTFVFKLTNYNSIIVQSFVVVGHSWNVFMKFNGGKGVACSIGLAYLNFPLLSIIPISLWWIIFFMKRIVSLSSIFSFLISSVFYSILYMFINLWLPYILLLWICTIIIIIRHKDNIKRLKDGNENSFK